MKNVKNKKCKECGTEIVLRDFGNGGTIWYEVKADRPHSKERCLQEQLTTANEIIEETKLELSNWDCECWTDPENGIVEGCLKCSMQWMLSGEFREKVKK